MGEVLERFHFQEGVQQVFATGDCGMILPSELPNASDDLSKRAELQFWSSRPKINKVWFSLFTPLRNAFSPEILSHKQRSFIVEDLLRLPNKYPILDMHEIAHSRDAYAVQPIVLSICAYDRNGLRRPENQDHALSVWGHPRLWAVRLHCFNGIGRSRGHHRVLGRLTAGHLFQNFLQCWRVV